MKILHTGPSGWDYYAWDEENTIESKTIHNHAIDLRIVGTVINERKILDGDDIEGFREFIHIILGLAERDGFTHIIDNEMDQDNPIFIRKIIPVWIRDWGTQDDYNKIVVDLPPSVLSYPTLSN